MNNRNLLITMTTLLAAGAGSAVAGPDCSESVCSVAKQVPDAIASSDELFMRDIAGRMINSLTLEEKMAIAAKNGIGSDALDLSHFTFDVDRSKVADIDPTITPREYRDLLFTPEMEARMSEGHLAMVEEIVKTLESENQPPALCFAPDMDREVALSINSLIEFRFSILFQQTNRWSNTATDGPGLQQGQPTTLTYSYIPDGTFVPNLGIGLGSGNSALFQWLNGIYGSPANWQPFFDQVFDRWSELTGLSYVFEPNDDGVNTNGAAGVLGVRGDVRIGAYDFQNDGNGGVLAYNNFPQDGDMIFDAFDTFYNNTGGNSLRLRNIISHEHGHGLGMLHVCPAVGTKLMEPFISTAFDGPQLDDILNGQRHYGDPLEPNDNAASASDLGSFGVGSNVVVGNVSVDDNSDDDFYEFTLTEPTRVIITLTPDADEFTQGPQTQACNTGNLTDFDSIQNLRIAIFGADDLVNPILLVDDNGIGEQESAFFDGETAGTYFMRIDTSISTNNIQRYNTSLFGIDLPFLGPVVLVTAPDAVDPGVTTDFAVSIDSRDDDLVGGSAELFTRVNGGSFTSSALTANGGDSFTASLPAVDCGDTLEFFVSVEGDTSGVVTFPAGGASDPLSAEVGSFVISFADDFQTDSGWAVTGAVPNQAAGRWQRGVPNGDGSRADAPEDADGSGACYLTGNGGAGSNTDVDGGDTVLTSPAFDVSGNPDATISYFRWFHNSFGDNANIETFQVEISDDNGGSWVDLETVAGNSPESNGGWFQKSFRIADFVSTTSEVRVRFIAKDDIGAVIEAGVDGVEVSGIDCEPPVTECAADLIADGSLNFLDISEFLNLFGSQDPAADFVADGSFNFLDVSAYLTLFGQGCP